MNGKADLRALWAAAECSKLQIDVLELRHLHGFSLRQIAHSMDKSVSTVRSHLEAAHRRIELHQRKEAA